MNELLEIREDAFRGANVRILKVDHRAARMQIEIRFAREPVRTWVEYEIAEPEQDPEDTTETTAEIQTPAGEEQQ